MITFKTYLEQIQHPVVKLIHQSLWNDNEFFNCSFDECLIPIVNASREALIETASNLPNSLKSTQQVQLAWLAMALNYSDLGFSVLQDIAGKFDIKKTDLLKLLFIIGNCEWIDEFTLENKLIFDAPTTDNPFEYAVRNNQLEVLRYLGLKMPGAEIEKIITSRCYLHAACNGFVEMLEHMEAKVSQKNVHEMIEYLGFYAYMAAAGRGHVAAMEHMESRAPNQIERMVRVAYAPAAANNQLQALCHMESKVSPQVIQQIIKNRQFDGYRLAAVNGHIQVLKHLELKLSAAEIREMIEPHYGSIYLKVAENGHLLVLEHLESKMSDVQTQKMIRNTFLSAYLQAAQNNHVDVLKYLELKAPDEVGNVIRMAYTTVAACGSVEALKHMESKVKFQDDKLFREAYCQAAARGQLHVLLHIESKVSAEAVQAIIGKGSVIITVALNGQIPVLKHLESKVRINYSVGFYKRFAENGKLELLKHIEALVPDAMIEDWIKNSGYEIYRKAALNGYFVILKHMVTKLPDHAVAMVEASGFEAYRFVNKAGVDPEIAKWMLSQSSSCFAYAEERGHSIIMPTVFDMLNKLRQEASNTSSLEVFDIKSSEQTKLCFYMLRHLIRRNDRRFDDDLRFLLHIPSVNALAHQEVTQGKPNELIRIALTTGNKEASFMLLDIPEVKASYAKQDSSFGIFDEYSRAVHFQAVKVSDMGIFAQTGKVKRTIEDEDPMTMTPRKDQRFD